MTAAALVCGSCGTELPPNAKFCNECGAAVANATTPAEYKQVTVLFADVVHSMDIAAAVGAERLREIMTDLVDRSSVVVKRYGGTVDKFTGDGIMAVFGAPTALEDHAIRACMAALDIQAETAKLAKDVEGRDGIALQLRIGLNSGQVIAGEIGSGALGYTAVGEQVGMAQRMESAAPPGAVMLSESTARLVEGAAVLGEPEMVRIKGAGEPVRARRLLGVAAQPTGPSESTLVGREWELAALAAMLDRSMRGRGSVVGLAGPAGIGKTRLIGEASQLGKSRGVEVFSTFCESHATDIPFRVVARLLRAVGQVSGLDDESARARVREQVPDADPQDMLLLDDLLGIADPSVELPKIDPDARRRRLTAMINAASLARTEPVLYIIEDAHWIDEVSESMLADFITVIPQTPSMVLITYRPDYEGALARVHGAQTIALAPLGDSETTALIGELLGHDPSAEKLVATMVLRVGGNPFFAEEMVRDLAERGVLSGHRGTYVCQTDIAGISVPATLQATIGARIDRLDREAKRALSAAAVIGSRFGTELLTDMGVEPAVEELVRAELIDQVRFTPYAEYAFRHPLIRTVAYESQLKSDRAELHRHLAEVIQVRDPESVFENAVLVAEHLEAAGDLEDAYSCHLFGAAWLNHRDIAAARVSWERARQIADQLPDDYPDCTAMRIAPRTMLCATAYRVHANIGDHFEELRELCTLADDKGSLPIAMTGLMMEHMLHARVREASRLASEQMPLLEAIGDPTLEMGEASLAMVITYETVAIGIRYQTGEMADILRWSQNVIDWADGQPDNGNLIWGSPLAVALVWRGVARWWLGRHGWRQDLDDAVAMGRNADPETRAAIVQWTYRFAIANGVLRADDSAGRELDEVLQIAEGLSDDYTLGGVKCALGVALAHRDAPADRQRGLELLAQVRDMCQHQQYPRSELPFVELYAAQERARRGNRDDAIPVMRKALNHMFQAGQLAYGVSGAAVLVEALLDRGAESDVAEAEAAIERLAAAPADEGLVMRDVWLLRLRALLARARGDDAAYAHYRDRYRDMAKTLGFEGHIAWAEAMP
jgi:class 3 adenylate cyclase